MSSKREDIKTELANASRDGLNSHEYWGELKTFSLQIIFIAIQLTQNLKKTFAPF